MTIFLVLVVALIINWLISIEVSKVAQTREIGKETAFWISFLLSPILGLLFVLASRPLSDEQISKRRDSLKSQITSEEDKQKMKQSFEKNIKVTQQVSLTLWTIVCVLFIIAINKA
jgi:hypothetical protein